VSAGIPKRVHLVGVGGAHMSAIARILLARGYQVSGSDLKRSPVVEALTSLGLAAYEGHAASNVGDAGLVVATSAAKDDNPELAEARRRGIPVIKRAEMVARLMEGRTSIAVSGTHGKTTTTGLVAYMLVRAGLAPTYLVGGELRDLGTNAAPGEGPHIVVEADEYDSAFLQYRPDVAIVTNIEPDHLEYFGTFERLVTEFAQFMAAVPRHGCLIACVDSPPVAELVTAGGAPGHPLRAGRIETYGLRSPAVWSARSLEPNAEGGFDFRVVRDGAELGTFRTRIPGEHNVSNALAAIIAGLVLGLSREQMRDAVAEYQGVHRRFEVVGQAGGVTVVDDFAHHPTEVRATVGAARVRFPGRRIVAVFQPHTYTRTQYLLEDFRTCFAGVDRLFILETYAARERPEEGLTGRDLAGAIAEPRPAYAATFDEAAERIAAELRPGDVLMTIGAGDVDRVGPMVLERLGSVAGAGNHG
jgi:UDP-N-acetylmuramate--alanine ligase